MLKDTEFSRRPLSGPDNLERILLAACAVIWLAALGAAVALVVAGAIDTATFTGTLGDSVIWLLLGSFIIAAAVTASGLSARIAARVLTVARSPRQLVHLITFALIVTTFAVPATSGRGAV